jgi:diguanylate cyclase (GGDEF)-like protein
MFRVWNCLEAQHDWRLVVTAALVCFLTSLAAINLYQRARDTDGRSAIVWLLTAGAVTGIGIWSTHFIAMLAYTPGFAFDYNLKLTVLSLVVAIAATTLGLTLALLQRARWHVAAGVVIGLGIAGMHYMGMASLNFVIVWNRDIVVASIVVGVVLAVAAMTAARRGKSAAGVTAAAALLALAITSHHFIAMGAIGLIPPVMSADDTNRITPIALCLAIAVATLAMVVAGLFIAVTDRKTQLRSLERGIQLDAALNNMGQGLCMFDADNRLQLWNTQYLQMYDLGPDQLAGGDDYQRLLTLRAAAGTSSIELEAYRTRLVAAIHDRVPANWMATLRDGRKVRVTYQPMANGGWVLTHEDHTERMRNQERVEFLAHHDALTQLPNRIALAQYVAAAIVRADDAGTGFAVVCLDLDRFKEINDLYGHAAGDNFLREVARRLTAASKGAFVARIGGDEFVIVVTEGEQPDSAEALCTRLIRAFEPDIAVSGVAVRGGCTMGIGIYPDNGRAADDLIANADAALYRAKADQRGTFRFFDLTLDNSLREKRILHRELIAAIEHKQFEAYFQPQATAAGDVVGFEVLARWNHPTRGLVAPDVFIPLAEETGLIRDIDEMIMREACSEAATWQRPLSIAVNLSPVDFRRGDVAGMILAILVATGLNPDRLHVEITEGVLLEDNVRASNELRRIKALGVHLAMDDFGKGYSSLSYLLMFPFDKIKIDRTFVAQLDSCPQSRAIVRAIIGLGHSLGLTVIAEGVEDVGQREILINKGCDQFQGFLLGRPQKASAFRMLASNLDTTSPDLRAAI